VIAQVDNKFILIKMASTTATTTPLLVLIDQHAADERVRVEALFEQLFSDPPLRCEPPLTFQVLPREAVLFGRHVQTFARWNIEYEVDDGSISATSLPAVISSRCHADPGLLLDTLRRHLSTLESSPPTPAREVPQTWTAGLAECPKGVCELLASRACRSAVMFGDALTKDECQVLVRRLAECAFPFGCAHGRPVMVPVVDLGNEPGGFGKV
jgi:DNA mismatch repair protein MLH3